jgi:osmotically-inducible protein OsmY
MIACPQLQIHVEDGWVILTGIVDYKYQREAVETAVHNLAGVKSITNHIKFKPMAVSSEVKTRIESAIRRAVESDTEKIQVEVSDHKVILRGKVHSWAEKPNVRHRQPLE